MKVKLEQDEVNRIVELLHEQRSGVESGEISGYDQTKQEELNDIDNLIYKLWHAQYSSLT